MRLLWLGLGFGLSESRERRGRSSWSWLEEEEERERREEDKERDSESEEMVVNNGAFSEDEVVLVVLRWRRFFRVLEEDEEDGVVLARFVLGLVW